MKVDTKVDTNEGRNVQSAMATVIIIFCFLALMANYRDVFDAIFSFIFIVLQFAWNYLLGPAMFIVFLFWADWKVKEWIDYARGNY